MVGCVMIVRWINFLININTSVFTLTFVFEEQKLGKILILSGHRNHFKVLPVGSSDKSHCLRKNKTKNKTFCSVKVTRIIKSFGQCDFMYVLAADSIIRVYSVQLLLLCVVYVFVLLHILFCFNEYVIE